MDTSMHTPTQASKRSTASTPTNEAGHSSSAMSSSLTRMHPHQPNHASANEEMATPCSSRPSYFSRGGGTAGGSSSGSGPRRNQFRQGRFPVRTNPFDCNITMIDKLQRPVLSPSLFNIVQSPNSESTSSSGRFWNIDQQSNLFPVEISDDSPWKQETAHSVMDPELENRTQEAINRYFNHTHDLKSPPDVPLNHSQINSTTLPMDTGASPILRPILAQSLVDNASSRRSSIDGYVKTVTTQYTQTVMSFPSELPESFEAQLATYFTFVENQRTQHKIISEIPTGPSSQQNSSQVQQPMDEQQNNLSTSRRKLFDCGPPDFEEEEEVDAFSDREEEETSHHWMSSPVKRLPSALDNQHGQSSEGEDVEHHFLIPRHIDAKTPTNPIVRSSTWSSGSKDPGTPQYRHRTSVSPAASMGSPTFSPIGPGNSTSILIGSFSRKESSSQTLDSNKENESTH